MSKLSILIYAVFTVSLQAQTIQIRFFIDPDTVSVNEKTHISWYVTGADRIYITDIGEVQSADEMAITSSTSRNYILIAANKKSVVIKSVRLGIEGPRNVRDPLPDPSEYCNPKTYKFSTQRFIPFCERLHTILQDSLRFSVDWADKPNNQIVVRTNSLIKKELLRDDDRGIRSRRISFYIIIYEPAANSDTFTYTVKALIEYQRFAESMWRQQKENAFYNDEILKLRQILEEI